MPRVTYHVRLLGEMELRRDGDPIALPRSKKTRALLAYLVTTGRTHRRARLCDLLWEQVADSRAGLRWSLSKLRPLFGDDEGQGIATDGEDVAFVEGNIEVDVLQLRALDRHGLRDAPTAALEEAAEALGRGIFLDGLELPDELEFHAWCSAERRALRTLHIQVLEALVGRRGAADEEALVWARDLVRLDRDRPEAHAPLLRTLIATGHAAEAHEHYESYRRRFSQQSGGQDRIFARLWRELGPASDSSASTVDSAMRRSPTQEIRFAATDDGARIAYATVGRGPPLVKTANWLTHLEFDWQSPFFRHWIDELSRGHRLIRYDERGNGLSDRDVQDFSLEAFLHDLQCVVDALGLERYPLVGISQGCAVAIAHAARHPERVTRMVLFGGYAQGWRVRGRQREIETAEAISTLARHGWGTNNPAFRQVFTSLYFPEASAEQMQSFNELQRRTTSAENAVALLDALGRFDVTDLLSQVRVPTLVMHSRHDALIPFEEGRKLAGGIPDARFVPLESRNHVLLEDEPAWLRFCEELRAFLDGAVDA